MKRIEKSFCISKFHRITNKNIILQPKNSQTKKTDDIYLFACFISPTFFSNNQMKEKKNIIYHHHPLICFDGVNNNNNNVVYEWP